MTATPRVEAFLCRYAGLSHAERREMQSTPEFEFLMARLRFGPDEPVPVEQMDLALELAVRYPSPSTTTGLGQKRRSDAGSWPLGWRCRFPFGSRRRRCHVPRI